MNCEKRLNKFGKYAFGINFDDTYIYFGMFDKEGNCIKNFVRFIEKTHHVSIIFFLFIIFFKILNIKFFINLFIYN